MNVGDTVLVKMPKGWEAFFPEWVEGKVMRKTEKGLQVYTKARRRTHPYPWDKIKEI